MMKKIVFVSLALSLTFLIVGVSAPASAELPDKGNFALSADRLFGYTHYKIKVKWEGPVSGSTTTKGNMTSILWANPTTPVPSAIPRGSFDYFVIDGLSLGGSLGYSTISAKVDSSDSESYDTFMFAPRVGYAFNFASKWSFWVRGGPTYTSTDDFSVYQLEADGMFVFAITEGFGFNFGPTLGLPLGGSGDAPIDSVSVTTFGITAGLLGWL
jgi:hypothetical protein